MASLRFDAEFIDCANSSVLCWLATVDSRGIPSVTPKQAWTVQGADQLTIANIASPHSVRNIMGNSAVCVSFIDVFRQRGFKVEGEAKILTNDDPGYRCRLEKLELIAGPDFFIRNIITVQAKSISPILAPSYRINTHVTEKEMMIQAYASYGVQPLETVRS